MMNEILNEKMTITVRKRIMEKRIIKSSNKGPDISHD